MLVAPKEYAELLHEKGLHIKDCISQLKELPGVYDSWIIEVIEEWFAIVYK